jgi:hypothetical protein
MNNLHVLQTRIKVGFDIMMSFKTDAKFYKEEIETYRSCALSKPIMMELSI